MVNKNDIVYTPDNIAHLIVDHFKPHGSILEPCCGDGAFLKYLNNADWCEIETGRDFFDYQTHIDWIISNPPFSIYDNFLNHSFEIADNIAYLIPLYKVFKSQKQIAKIKEYGGIKEILIIGSGSKIGFNMGFLVGCVYYKKYYIGDIKVSYLGE